MPQQAVTQLITYVAALCSPRAPACCCSRAPSFLNCAQLRVWPWGAVLRAQVRGTLVCSLVVRLVVKEGGSACTHAPFEDRGGHADCGPYPLGGGFATCLQMNTSGRGHDWSMIAKCVLLLHDEAQGYIHHWSMQLTAQGLSCRTALLPEDLSNTARFAQQAGSSPHPVS